MSSPINVYSISEARERIEESLPSIFKQLGYTESHMLGDIRLGLGYAAALMAAGSFMLDRKFGHDPVREWHMLLVIGYFLLSGVLYCYSRFVERGTVYVGVDKNSSRIQIRATVENFRPLYNINFEHKTAQGVAKQWSANLEINQVFTEQGHLQFNLLKSWMESQLLSGTKQL